MIDLQYDDTNLQKLFASFSPEQRIKTLKRAFSKEARRVRKVAIENLHQSIDGDKELEKGIRTIVFRKKAGFRVTIGTKRGKRNGQGERGFYISRRRRGKKDAYGRELTGRPVLIFAEQGTGPRSTRSRFWPVSRRSHSTGAMKSYGFMYKTQLEVRDNVTENVQRAFMQSIMRNAKKYGCN